MTDDDHDPGAGSTGEAEPDVGPTGDEWTVLVPVEVLEGEAVPESVVDLLSTLPVVVLGYHVLPEQTAPGQARLQFEDRAQARLDDLAAEFRAAGGAAETRLVFTHDEEQTLDRVADETDCGAILVPNPAPEVERLLVPVRGAVDVDRIAALVAALIGDRPIDVTLFHVAETDEDLEAAQSVVDGAREALTGHGLDPERVAQSVKVSRAPVDTIAEVAAEHDAVVMGESAPSLRDFLFGEPSEQVAARSLGPVVVVRRDHNDRET